MYYSQAKNAGLTVSNSGEALTLLVEDDGMPCDPTTAKESDLTLSAEKRAVGEGDWEYLWSGNWRRIFVTNMRMGKIC